MPLSIHASLDEFSITNEPSLSLIQEPILKIQVLLSFHIVRKSNIDILLAQLALKTSGPFTYVTCTAIVTP